MDGCGTVLLVEDNDELRDATRDLLVALGHTVILAATGEEALALFVAADPEAGIDLVVADLFLPGMSGIELVDRLLERRDGLAVVLLSSPRDDLFLRRRLERGDVRFLLKPFSADQLRTALEAARAPRSSPPARDLRRLVSRQELGGAHRLARASRRARVRRTSWRQRSAWGLAAAAVVVAVTGVLQTAELPPLFPQAGAGTVRRGTAVELLWPVGELANPPAELRFEQVEGALSYRLRVLEIDDTVLWQDTVAAPPADLPLEVRARLRPAVVYSWSVEALDAEGRRVAGSASARFRIRPGARRVIENSKEDSET